MHPRYWAPVPQPCQYGPLGCLMHPHAPPVPGAPWCARGRRVVLAVAAAYSRAATTPAGAVGWLGRRMWASQQAQLQQAAAHLKNICR